MQYRQDETRPYKELDVPIKESNTWNISRWDDNELDIYFQLEYIDNAEDAKIWGEYREAEYNLEPWELYKKRRYHCMSDAVSSYMKFYADEDIADVKMWMIIERNEKIVYEEAIEPYTSRYELRRIVNEGMRKEVDNVRHMQSEIQSEFDMMTKFINYSKQIKEMYKRFKEQTE